MMKRTKVEAAPACQPQDHAGHALPVLRPQAMERAAGIFRALGDTPRLRLLALLSQGPACVTELAEAEAENISTISQRLKVLHAENLVTRKRQGKHIQYMLADQHVVDLLFNAMAHATEHPPEPIPLISGALEGPPRGTGPTTQPPTTPSATKRKQRA
jgi:ArsR family transcriptional regulator